MRPIEEIKLNHKVSSVMANGKNIFSGVVRLSNGRTGSVVFGYKEDGKYDHVSFSPFQPHHIPTWDEMCEVKDIFYGDEEETAEIHPKKSEYVNMMSNCLHLWARSDGGNIL